MRRIVHFLLFVFHYVTVVLPSSLIIGPHLCPMDQSFMLWQFRQSIHIDATASLDCRDQNVQSYPKMMSWNLSTDCCTWDGVTCDEFSGQVIGLDLSCSQLQGVVDSNSSLFQLSHLQSLNLAYNDFSSSLISGKFGDLQSLRHLNLSNSEFSGSLPSEFLRLFNLISLDLSSFEDITIPPHIFELLLQNLTRLRQLSLNGDNIASVLPHNLSASLEDLNLGSTNLFGELPLGIFQLPNLQTLQLTSNEDLTGSLFKTRWNTSSALSYLDLSSTGLSGELPESIGNLRSLSYLDLSYCSFSGSIPESFANLTQMTYMRLSYNEFSGQVPSSLANLKQLVSFDLAENDFEGQMPNFFHNFKMLTNLFLNGNSFNGYFPSSVLNLTNLSAIDLSNNSLIGPLPQKMSGFPNLVLLFLGTNSFNSTIPYWVFSSLPSLRYLGLESNHLTGQVSEFQYPSLRRIYLNGNKLHGPIPKSISALVNLTELDLSFNNFSGPVEVSLFSNLEQLVYLDLSFNSLSLIDSQVNSTLPSSLGRLFLSSCGVKDLDFFLGGAYRLVMLDLSDNKLTGQIFTDQESYNWGQRLFYLNLSRNFLTDIRHLPFQHLVYLDLRSNLLNGQLIVPTSVDIQYFLVSDNNFSGEIPSSMCNLTSLVLLDMADNNLSGLIPPCLGNISTELSLLDLHSNNFHGTIPSGFSVGSNLRSLNLRDNWLQETVPRSLSNCRELEILDFGNNNLSGTFPWWLETLPKLQVLSLRTNRLYGRLNISRTGLSFPALRILDLSGNEFNGALPASFFRKLNGMKMVNRGTKQPMFKEELLYYQASMVMTIKGQELDVENILSILTTIDLSNNKFQGLIPDVIGNLVSLQCLNLSHNTLGGEIPQMLGNIVALESLDLSSNQLEGEIPQQLTALTYLSVLNLSENHLVGSIPKGQQFNTFDNSSYLGNEGLCGFPLSKICGANELVPPTSTTPPARDEKDKEDFMNGFTWKAVLIGYGSGMVIGMSVGCLSFMSGKPKWFNKIVEEEASRFIKKKWPKEVKWLSK